jgi:hypothetical protein
MVKQDPSDGFSERERSVVEALNNFIVTALDDLEPTRGTETTELNPDGTYTKYIGEGKFGMSRVATPVVFQHDDVQFVGAPLTGLEIIDTPEGKKYERAPYVPHFVASADGKPLTSDNISVVWTGRGGKLDGESDLLAAIRRKVSVANMGEDFGFEAFGYSGWAKPLKLTKKECLSFHPGMNVGDTVAIAAYLSPKK